MLALSYPAKGPLPWPNSTLWWLVKGLFVGASDSGSPFIPAHAMLHQSPSPHTPLHVQLAVDSQLING